MKFVIEINTDNDAFADGNRNYEVARILKYLVDQHESYGVMSPYIDLRDINGNVVGHAEFIEGV